MNYKYIGLYKYIASFVLNNFAGSKYFEILALSFQYIKFTIKFNVFQGFNLLHD